jgi:fatty acid desaturase
VTKTPILFRYSYYDAIPAVCGIGILSLIFWTFLCFDSLSWWVLAPAFVAIAWSYCWNMQCISHNFIHNAFFQNVWLNRAYSVLLSLDLGVPHVLYHHYHLNHHWGDSDAVGPDGSTRDWSSIYRYGKDGQPEAFWKYCLVSFFRVEAGPVLKTAYRNHHLPQVAVESLALGAMWIAMAVVNWRYFLLFYLPSYYLGWVLSYAEGYLEHYGCQPGNHYANSVSSYNWIYNVLWFNNGYHQEHHWDPKVHWTKMTELYHHIKGQLAANHTRTLRGPHITAFVEDWLTGHHPPTAAGSGERASQRTAA